MTLKIGENIDAVTKRIKGDETLGIPPDRVLANDIAEAGIKAMFCGIGTFDETGIVTEVTNEWKKLMRYFAAENSKELARLCGQDRDFNESDWGFHCLAYIAGDSTCTSETATMTGTKRSMRIVPERKMLENLDAEGPDLERFAKTEGDSTSTLMDVTSTPIQKGDLNSLSNTDSSDTNASNDGEQ